MQVTFDTSNLTCEQKETFRKLAFIAQIHYAGKINELAASERNDDTDRAIAAFKQARFQCDYLHHKMVKELEGQA